MQIEVLWKEDEDFLTSEQLFINGERKETVFPLCECPEDAIIGRDLISCQDIVKYMKLAYEAGKADERLEYSLEKVEYFD